jgi:hypothetical protein
MSKKSVILLIYHRQELLDFIHDSKTYVLVHPNTKLNSFAVVRKRTIPTERPPLVGEVSANL